MRDIKIGLVLVVVAVGLSACGELLQETPESFIVQSQYYTDEDQAVSGIYGIYSVLTTPGGYALFYRMSSFPTDEGKTGGVYQPSGPLATTLDNFTFNATHRVFDNVWSNHYDGINRANLAIAKIPDIPSMSEGEKNHLVAEAKFLRALFYFNLVRWFGGVPLVTDYTDDIAELEVPRAGLDSVYQLIIDDLQFAVENLSPSYPPNEAGRATEGAALSLLGKVYLTRNNWNRAVQALKAVIDLNRYSLLPDYMALWDGGNENNSEIIFSVQYEAGVINNPYSRRFAPRSSGIQASQSFGEVAPESSLLSKYLDGDERLQLFKDSYAIYNSSDSIDFGWPFCFKYFDLAIGGTSGRNFPVLRYADVLLMYAEAKNEISGPGGGQQYSALWALNKVRERAGLSAITNTGKSALREAIWLERARELCFEGHRWFDLVRTNRLVEVVGATGKTVSDRHTLFPIPQREMGVNRELVQNPGY